MRVVEMPSGYVAGRSRPAVTVGISLYNYERYVIDTLESVRAQTLESIEIIVVDDASSDGGALRAERWLRRHSGRFVRTLLIRQSTNAGLAAARNRAVDLAAAPYFFVLDADNLLYPRCLEQLRTTLRATPRAAFAYSLIEIFGSERGLMGTPVWSRQRLREGNYIDAMALIRTRALRQVKGYAKMVVPGWEDYDLWCRFAERGWIGVRVPQILARYRTHTASMLNTITRRRERAALLLAQMKRRHPWLRIGT
jgi:glycosyltransferase involved in cell wall biosynthesis